MKNIKRLILLSIVITPLLLIGQSKLVMGGGLIVSKFEKANTPWGDLVEQNIDPFVGFSYEHNLNKSFYLSTNANYSRQQIISSIPSSLDTLIRFSSFESFPSDIDFVQISAGASLNCKIITSEKYPIFLRGFNIGIGINIDHLRDFKDVSFFFSQSPRKFSYRENRSQLGLLYHLSWDYKKFRLTYNSGQGLMMFGNHENLVLASDWRTFSASYIYTLSD